MTNEQELFVLIIIFAVTFRYLYKNRIIYQKELIKQEERERKQRKRRYKKYQRKMAKAEKKEQKKMIKAEKKSEFFSKNVLHFSKKYSIIILALKNAWVFSSVGRAPDS